MRVLLVEDDTATAKSVEMMLKSEGYVCDCTDLGEDGLEIGKLYDYDLIILDLMLPDMDGYEVLRRLRAARVQTPILILSGLIEPDQKVKGLGFGADDYLTKPFDKGELIARIQAVVRRSKGYSESGSWTSSSSATKIYGADYRFAQVSSNPNAFAEFRPTLPESGRYPVYLWFSKGRNRSGQARFTVHHSGGETSVILDQNDLGDHFVKHRSQLDATIATGGESEGLGDT